MICILTDFGTESIYVAEMLGVIKSINPYAEVLMLENNIERQNVLQGSFLLKHISKEYPHGTIFLVVVDPGVGTERKPIIVETKKHIYIGPDNGLFYPVASEEGVISVYEIDIEKLPARKISKTFHGRDIFAVAASILSIAYRPYFIAKKVEKMTELSLPTPKLKDNEIEGIILYCDSFGNLVTNISSKELESLGFLNLPFIKVKFLGKDVSMVLPFKSTYGEVKEGEPLLLIDSFDLLEIAINKGSAKDRFSLNQAETISISRV